MSQVSILKRQSEKLAMHQVQLSNIQDDMHLRHTQVSDQLTVLVSRSQALGLTQDTHRHEP